MPDGCFIQHILAVELLMRVRLCVCVCVCVCVCRYVDTRTHASTDPDIGTDMQRVRLIGGTRTHAR